MASLLRTLTYTTGSIAPGTSTSRNDTIVGNIADIVKIKVAPSNLSSSELCQYQIFKYNTFLSSDLVYNTVAFNGNLIDPIEYDGITQTERNEGYVARYEDGDNAQQLHNKITNSGTLAKTYTVTITYLSITEIHGGLSMLNAEDFGGSDAAVKINAAISALPTTGGVVDARSLGGAQAWSSNPFFSLSTTKPVHLILGVGTTTISADTTVPLNVSIEFPNGAILVTSAAILTIAGQIIAGRYQIFGSTTIPRMGSSLSFVYPEWWGAIANGANPPTFSTNSTVAIQAATDALISGANLNTIQNAPSGVVLFGNGTYYITSPISTCHYNGCTGTAAPDGVINACVTFRGISRPATSIFTDQSIDMFQMYSYACPSSVEDMTIVASALTTGVRIRGNSTLVKNIWFHIFYGVIIENTHTLQTADAHVRDCLFDSNGQGGPGNGITITNNGDATYEGPIDVQATDNACHGGNLCIVADAGSDCQIRGVHSDGAGSAAISLSGVKNFVVSDVVASGASGSLSGGGGSVSNFETGIAVATSTSVSLSNIGIRLFNGPALTVASSTGVELTGFNFTDNCAYNVSAVPYDLQTDGSEVHIKSGNITNNNGFPAHAVQFQSSASPLSFCDLDSVTIKGSKYTGTVINVLSGASATQKLSLTNNDIRTSWSSGPLIHLDAVLHAFVRGNSISSGAVTTWLESNIDGTEICISGNLTASGKVTVGVANTNVGLLPNGCWSGSVAIGDQVIGNVGFSQLGTQENGTVYYCIDCNIANPCTGGGTGAQAKRIAGIWICN